MKVHEKKRDKKKKRYPCSQKEFTNGERPHKRSFHPPYIIH